LGNTLFRDNARGHRTQRSETAEEDIGRYDNRRPEVSQFVEERYWW